MECYLLELDGWHKLKESSDHMQGTMVSTYICRFIYGLKMTTLKALVGVS